MKAARGKVREGRPPRTRFAAKGTLALLVCPRARLGTFLEQERCSERPGVSACLMVAQYAASSCTNEMQGAEREGVRVRVCEGTGVGVLRITQF